MKLLPQRFAPCNGESGVILKCYEDVDNVYGVNWYGTRLCLSKSVYVCKFALSCIFLVPHLRWEAQVYARQLWDEGYKKAWQAYVLAAKIVELNHLYNTSFVYDPRSRSFKSQSGITVYRDKVEEGSYEGESRCPTPNGGPTIGVVEDKDCQMFRELIRKRLL